MGYTHHGIYVGDGNVVHYGALMYDLIRKPVEEVSLAAFAEGRPVYVVTHCEGSFDAAEIIRRARSRLGEKQYRLLSNNCEHFVEWCLHDRHRSFQVEIALEFPRWFGEKILAALLKWLRSGDIPRLLANRDAPRPNSRGDERSEVFSHPGATPLISPTTESRHTGNASSDVPPCRRPASVPGTVPR
jgi:hypothetical protein